ncbi:MAG: hypothetical protein JWR69_2879 [Pedosphaera sp.]|nr:hypothetical protein [Pedosphaera sp.]
MFIRISLVLAIVAALAAASINFLQVHRKITTTLAERNQFRVERDQEAAANLEAQKLASGTQAKLDQAANKLALTKGERNQAIATGDEQAKRAVALAAALKKTQAELEGFNKELAVWKSLKIPVEQVRPTLASLKPLTEECAQLAAEKKILLAETTRLEGFLAVTRRANGTKEDYGEDFVALPEGLKGRVLVADPKHNFVVLDIGEKQGVLEAGQMLVNRNGKLVAKVAIRSVQSDRCIADVMPGWKLDALSEGDQVIY